METGRMVLAIALSFLVFIVWEFLFVDKEAMRQPPPQTTQTQKAKAPAGEKSAVSGSKKNAAVEETAAPKAAVLTEAQIAAQNSRPARMITVENPFYTCALSEKGAAIKSFVLKKYREKADPKSPLKQIISPTLERGTLLAGLESHHLKGLSEAVFNSGDAAEKIDVSGSARKLVFTWTAPDGITIEKSYTFQPDSYLIKMQVRIRNQSGREIKDRIYLSLLNTLPTKHNRYGFEGPSAYINGKLEQIPIKKIKEKNKLSGHLQWLAIESQYFMSSVIVPQAPEAGMQLILHDKSILENRYLSPEVTIAPAGMHTLDFDVFLGPKRLSLLKSIGGNLDKAVNFGMFDFIAKPCLWLMNFIYRFIPNYGVAIIFLTILTKVLLWPLGNKSYKSMSEMKKLQPLMAEIREKYKGDKKKINEEMMALYKTYKINPMGGCLPMIVQIPVFFALYRMLYQAIELRHAPFFLWINDLSAPDRLFRFNFSIPFMEPPYGIPVLTIIMGATMFLQQKMSPPMGDATQAKMMMLMPVVFTFIFINFSSGLVLYWLVNNILSIAQQYYVQKKYA